MPDIFKYKDYRHYLLDFYREKKEVNHFFSYRIIADKAGFKSKSFFPQVIKGTRNLSERSVIALGKVLKISDVEMAYFKALVAFNQSKTQAGKELHFLSLMELVSQNKAKITHFPTKKIESSNSYMVNTNKLEMKGV